MSRLLHFNRSFLGVPCIHEIVNTAESIVAFQGLSIPYANFSVMSMENVAFRGELLFGGTLIVQDMDESKGLISRSTEAKFYQGITKDLTSRCTIMFTDLKSDDACTECTWCVLVCLLDAAGTHQQYCVFLGSDSTTVFINPMKQNGPFNKLSDAVHESLFNAYKSTVNDAEVFTCFTPVTHQLQNSKADYNSLLWCLWSVYHWVGGSDDQTMIDIYNDKEEDLKRFLLWLKSHQLATTIMVLHMVGSHRL
jgi:hypothetical protein